MGSKVTPTKNSQLYHDFGLIFHTPGTSTNKGYFENKLNNMSLWPQKKYFVN
jgi:hypothetical protein